MSAPNTNIEKQAKEHKTPLIGMGSVVVFAGVLLLLLLVWAFATGNDPADEGAEGTVTPSTGAVVDSGEGAPATEGN